MNLNSFYNNNKYNNADIFNYKYPSIIPKINNSKPSFFPKIHSKFSQKIAPIIKTTFGTTPLLSNTKSNMNKKILKTHLTHSNYDLPMFSWYLDNKILLDYNLRSNLRYKQFNSLPELQQKQPTKPNKLPQLAKRFEPPSNTTESFQYTKDYIQFIRNKPLQLKPIQNHNNYYYNNGANALRNTYDYEKKYDFSFEWFSPSSDGQNESDIDEAKNNKAPTPNMFENDSLIDFNDL